VKRQAADSCPGKNNEDQPRITRMTRMNGCTLSDEPQIRIRAIRVTRCARQSLADGKKLYYYGNSTVETFDAETLESSKIMYLEKDTTTNLITLPLPVKTAGQ
jgi:hypothetical protein